MTQSRTIAVTGATGFVGRHLVRELLSRGHRVRALVRDPAKARKHLGKHDCLELVVGAALDRTSPAEVVKGCDSCTHLIGIIREVRGVKSGGAGGASDGPQTFERMHVGTTTAMLEACMNAGVKRFIQMSSLGADPDGKALYQRTKYEAEVLVRRSGLDWTIFRPSLIHGSDGELVQMIHDMASGHAPPWYFMPYFAREVVDQSVPLGPSRLESARLQPVAVEDVAWCFAEALEKDISIGEVYNLVGPDTLTWPQLMAFYRDRIPGADPNMPIAPLPGTMGAFVALAAGKLGLGGLLPFDRGQALMSMEDSVSEQHKVRAHLGLDARAFRPSAEKYAASMQTAAIQH